MAQREKETALYLRNMRPNKIAFKYGDVRYALERRGTRADSTSLPIEAASDALISRWMKTGVLEKISRDSFMRLAARTVDIEPNQYLARPVRSRKGDLSMNPADADTTRSLTQIRDTDVVKAATPKLTWAGELMTTEEEIESGILDDLESQNNYPSHHRNDGTQFNMR